MREFRQSRCHEVKREGALLGNADGLADQLLPARRGAQEPLGAAQPRRPHGMQVGLGLGDGFPARERRLGGGEAGIGDGGGAGSPGEDAAERRVLGVEVGELVGILRQAPYLVFQADVLGTEDFDDGVKLRQPLVADKHVPVAVELGERRVAQDILLPTLHVRLREEVGEFLVALIAAGKHGEPATGLEGELGTEHSGEACALSSLGKLHRPIEAVPVRQREAAQPQLQSALNEVLRVARTTEEGVGAGAVELGERARRRGRGTLGARALRGGDKLRHVPAAHDRLEGPPAQRRGINPYPFEHVTYFRTTVRMAQV